MSKVTASATKSFFTNEMEHIKRSEDFPVDLGYSLDIPWNTIYTAGWQDAKPTHDTGSVWGRENVLTTSNRPEFYAPDNIVRTTGNIPQINIQDPQYMFDREKYSYRVF